MRPLLQNGLNLIIWNWIMINAIFYLLGTSINQFATNAPFLPPPPPNGLKVVYKCRRNKDLGDQIKKAFTRFYWQDLKFGKYDLTKCEETGTLIRISIFMTFALRKNIISLLDLSLAISHLFGCFAGDKLMHIWIIYMRALTAWRESFRGAITKR